MQRILIFFLLFVVVSGCIDSGYNQPVYIISDGSQEEEQITDEIEDEEQL